MSENVINMEDYLKNSYFNEEVLPFFQMMNTQFDYFLEKNSSLFTFPYKNNYLYVFLEYVPRNQFTDKPTVLDRFFNVKIDPRTSNGEWVVKKIFEIGYAFHEELKTMNTSENYIETAFNEILK